MAAFSYQHQPSLLDSVFFPDSSSSSPIKMPSCLLEQHMDYISASSFTYFPSVSLHGCCSSALENQAATFSGVEHKADSSSLPLELENGGGNLLHQQQSDMIMDKKRKNKCVSWFKDAEYSKDPEETQSKRQKKYCNGSFKEREEKKPKAFKKSLLKNSGDGEPPSGYIHVRARRGEATDSHSLAERVRREKISERMRILQGLVPGCNKVSGKALILDEIINYVRSLQTQVEFLSMKLACINPPPLSHFASVDIEDPIVESEKVRSIASQLSSIQHTVANSYYPLMESATSILPRPQSPNETFSQDNAKLLWNGEEQRQQFLNSAAFANLCTF